MDERLIFLIDQDGPLAAFDPYFYKRCAEAGIEIEGDHTDQVHRFATGHIADEDQRQRARDMVDTPGWFLDLPVVDGAVDGINRLAEVPNSEVWICTKPLEPNVSCRDDKAAWVRKYLGDEWEHRLILAPDKSLVRGHVLLDDAPVMESVSRAAWVPVVYPMNWNQIGSEWDGLLNWDWTQDIDILVDIAKANAYYSSR